MHMSNLSKWWDSWSKQCRSSSGCSSWAWFTMFAIKPTVSFNSGKRLVQIQPGKVYNRNKKVSQYSRIHVFLYFIKFYDKHLNQTICTTYIILFYLTSPSSTKLLGQFFFFLQKQPNKTSVSKKQNEVFINVKHKHGKITNFLSLIPPNVQTW